MIPPACTSPARNLGPEEYTLKGCFAPNGADDPDPSSIRKSLGFQFTVAHVDTGLYMVTVGSQFSLPKKPIAWSVDVSTNGDGDYIDAKIVGGFDGLLDSTDLTFLIGTYSAGDLSDLGPTAGVEVSFALEVSNSTGA
jgi:hypothetical protein